jgi:hypothetical protein
LFRRNSGCSAEQKTLGILLRINLQRRKKLGILYRRTKIEANSRNFDSNHSTADKPTRNSVPWNKKRSKLSEFRSEACIGQKHAGNSVCWSRIFCIFFMSFRSVPSFGIDSSANLGMPGNGHFLPRDNGNHSEFIPRNFFGTKFC